MHSVLSFIEAGAGTFTLIALAWIYTLSTKKEG